MIFMEIESGELFLMLIKTLDEFDEVQNAWTLGEFAMISSCCPLKAYVKTEIASHFEFIGFL